MVDQQRPPTETQRRPQDVCSCLLLSTICLICHSVEPRSSTEASSSTAPSSVADRGFLKHGYHSRARRCKACDQHGHRAFFCPNANSQNLSFKDSGHRAFNQLPDNTDTWELCQRDMHAAFQALKKASCESDERQAVYDLAEQMFARGWRYCCWKDTVAPQLTKQSQKSLLIRPRLHQMPACPP